MYPDSIGCPAPKLLIPVILGPGRDVRLPTCLQFGGRLLTMTGNHRSRTAKLSLLTATALFVCPGVVSNAFADNWFTDSAEHAATTKTVQGQVSVERDMRLWALDVGDKVKVQETIVTGKDGHALFQVTDGSTFEVFPNAKVVFRKTAGNWRDSDLHRRHVAGAAGLRLAACCRRDR